MKMNNKPGPGANPGANPAESGQADSLPAGLAQPARRALLQAGYTRLEQLAGVSEAELKQLHGMGPKAIEVMREALAARGLSFASPVAKKTKP
jgi:hypothetical protein